MLLQSILSFNELIVRSAVKLEGKMFMLHYLHSTSSCCIIGSSTSVEIVSVLLYSCSVCFNRFDDYANPFLICFLNLSMSIGVMRLRSVWSSGSKLFHGTKIVDKKSARATAIRILLVVRMKNPTGNEILADFVSTSRCVFKNVFLKPLQSPKKISAISFPNPSFF